jgi:hypothetical protein
MSVTIALIALAAGTSTQAKSRHNDAPPPIRIAVAPPAIPAPAPSVPSEQYGDWTAYGLGGGLFMATTTNSGGAVFGTICTKETCFAFLNPKLSCTPEAKYPALVNAPAGAFSVEIQCEKVDDLLVYTFDIGGEMANIMSIGGVLGIAFPMASGQFEVSRFSLTGAARAAARVQQLAQGQAPATAPQNATDNSTL